LYNWYAVNTGKLAPTGWHVPTDAEWTTLENYLIANGYNYDGSTSGDYYAKSLAATTDWAANAYEGSKGTIGDDLSENNRTGFSALPGGWRDGIGFIGVGDYSFWWSSTDSKWSLGPYDRGLDREGGFFKSMGYSVRCVMDN